MAIYHLRAEVISRSAGRSATAAAAYRSGTEIEDRRTGSTFDYARRGGVEHTEILAPGHASDWASDRSELWNKVEEAETRKNSQVAREIRLALPSELDAGERAELVREFCEEAFVSRGMVADIAIHEPSRKGDERNHHAHVMLTTREIGPEGFGKKNRDWNKVEALEAWRSSWAERSNDALERVGSEERIDHRTLEAQREEAQGRAEEARERGDEEEALRETVRAVSLDREPLPQLSPGAWQMKERGIDVPAVQVWHEVRAQARQVAEVAGELAGQVRDWIDRTAERALERLRGPELAREGPGDAEPARDEFAERLRELLDRSPGRGSEGRDEGPSGGAEREEPGRDQGDNEEDDRRSLAERLRDGAGEIDDQNASQRLQALRDGWDADRQHQKREEARKVEKERAQERGRDRDTDRGMDWDR